jgi:peptide/nickel transport system ATP-binding protein
MTADETVLRVEGLTVTYVGGRRESRVLTDVSFALPRSATLAIVGESGSGKSTTAMAVAGLLPTTARVEGRVVLDGVDLLRQRPRDLDDVRGNDIAVVFQNPMTSLNPTMRVGNQIAEQLLRHRPLSRRAARGRAVELLEEVLIRNPDQVYDKYPHQLSGGMRQRVMIAMAVSCEPRVLIADEPTTALDVTVQAEILQILRALGREHRMGLVLVTHDMGVVAEMADDVAVMHGGRFVEYAPVAELFDHPLHPYTEGLLAAQPRIDDPEARHRRLPTIPRAAPMLEALSDDWAPAMAGVPGEVAATRFVRVGNGLVAVAQRTAVHP